MRKIFAVLFVVLSITACGGESKEQTQDVNKTEVQQEKPKQTKWEIDPAGIEGIVNRTTTRDSLNKYFDSMYMMDDGYEEDGKQVKFTIVKGLEITWKEDGTPQKVDFYGIDDTWSVKGIAPRVPIAKLQELNGKPFEFTGFELDFGGYVSDWNGGNLNYDNVETGLYFDRIKVENEEIDTSPFRGAKNVFSSDLPALEPLNIYVVRFIVHWD